MTNSILHTLEYFALFAYPPTLSELHTFLNIKTTERELKFNLNKLQSNNKVIINNERIALSEHVFKIYYRKYEISKKYYQKALKYLSWIEIIPSLQMLAISGSLSMMNTKKEGDIDLFVITEANSIWSTRFLLLIYKYVLKIIDPHIGNKLCFNLFFSKDELEIRKIKQNEYIAHEVLQLKPLINKNNSYSELVSENKWINDIFPNRMRLKVKSTSLLYKSKFTNVEFFLKFIQKWWLKRKNINYLETSGQVWFIQKDFEEKIPLKFKRLY